MATGSKERRVAEVEKAARGLRPADPGGYAGWGEELRALPECSGLGEGVKAAAIRACQSAGDRKAYRAARAELKEALRRLLVTRGGRIEWGSVFSPFGKVFYPEAQTALTPQAKDRAVRLAWGPGPPWNDAASGAPRSPVAGDSPPAAATPLGEGDGRDTGAQDAAGQAVGRYLRRLRGDEAILLGFYCCAESGRDLARHRAWLGGEQEAYRDFAYRQVKGEQPRCSSDPWQDFLGLDHAMLLPEGDRPEAGNGLGLEEAATQLTESEGN